MTTIITGNFEEQALARKAASDLEGAGFSADQISVFYVGPPGQHDRYPVGGDRDESPGTEHVAAGSAAGAAVGGVVGLAVGLATLPLLGPGAVVAGAGAGAYVGSLYGAMGTTEDHNNPETPAEREVLEHSERPRTSGVLVAVTASASAQQDTAIGILRAHGATDIERTEGTVVGGNWTGFNPLTPLRLVGDEIAQRDHEQGAPSPRRGY